MSKSSHELFELACRAHREGDFGRAEELYRQTVEGQPAFAEAWNNIGILQRERGDFSHAAENFRKAVNLRSDNATFLVNLGLVSWMLRRYDEAGENLRAAVAISPQLSPIVHHALAQIAWILSEDPLPVIEKAIELFPSESGLHWDKACILLARGDFNRGWGEFEYRFYNGNFKYLETFTMPIWSGQNLTGKTLYVHAEQGLGDVIQFSRFLKLTPSAEKIIFGVPHELERFFKSNFPEIEILPMHGFEMPLHLQADFHTPLCSLAMRCGVTAKNLPAGPYLTVKSGKKQIATAGKNVGIVWAGSTVDKSVDLKELESAFAKPGISLYSLQFGPNANDVEKNKLDGKIKKIPLHDMQDTAEIVAQLDAVVTVDTSVAHLAGALGKPCHVLLSAHLTDWRWLGPKWYSSCVVYRQKLNEPWSEVFGRIAGAL